MTTIDTLTHVERPLTAGGKVVVLDPGSVLSAEAVAMLQALHSRSTAGIAGHLKVLAERGPEKFMSTYYVGYGHKSIGDCGTAIVFIEGVSMLAAKAIQDSKLYNGQESSTRYIDFAQQPFHNPAGTEAGTAIQEGWRSFYLHAVAELQDALPARFPRQADEPEKTYHNAIAARAFDIARGFLPAGASTNVAWSTTLRQFDDRILQLSHHPLAEVREIAAELHAALLTAYPNSFKADTPERREKYAATHQYLEAAAPHYYHHDPDCPDFALVRDSIDRTALAPYQALLSERPPQTELPKWLGVYGELAFAFRLDFGSFRDLQRHRAITQRMPLLTAELGFHPWYLTELTDGLRPSAQARLEELTQAAEAVTSDLTARQYYLPMGYQISNYLSGDLPALLYLVELRASSLVHPTLASKAAKMATAITEALPELPLALHLHSEPGRFDVKRGEATIETRDETTDEM